jgi:hypothetical protein
VVFSDSFSALYFRKAVGQGRLVGIDHWILDTEFFFGVEYTWRDGYGKIYNTQSA